MSPPSSRAAHLRGALVGGCSAVITSLAHAVGGGGLPSGAVLPFLLVVFATVGGVTSRLARGGQFGDAAVVVVALCGAQFLGHVTLVVAGGHHHGGLTVSAPMLAAHVGAALLLGLLISVSEYLYILAVSVLCWLRLVAVDRSPAVVRSAWRPTNAVVVQTILLRSGLGMRAPPRRSRLGA